MLQDLRAHAKQLGCRLDIEPTGLTDEEAMQVLPDHPLVQEVTALVERPTVMLGVNVVAADTDDEAHFLASSGRQSFASLRSGRPIPLPPPSAEWVRDPSDRSDPSNQTRVSFVGSASTIRPQMERFVAETGADELIVVSHIYDHAARLRSYELASRL